MDIGATLAAFAPWIATGLVAVGLFGLSYVLNHYLADYKGLAKTAQVDQLLTKAITFGVNTVVGAEQGKTLTINTAYPVLNQALAYVLEHGPSWLEQFAGTPDQLAQKIVARLPLDPEIPMPNFAQVALDVTDKIAPAKK